VWFYSNFDGQLNDAFGFKITRNYRFSFRRYNGGGSVQTATDASMITGQFSGFSKLEWNSNYSDNNTNYIFQVT
jgi:hypothetical protein